MKSSIVVVYRVSVTIDYFNQWNDEQTKNNLSIHYIKLKDIFTNACGTPLMTQLQIRFAECHVKTLMK